MDEIQQFAPIDRIRITNATQFDKQQKSKMLIGIKCLFEQWNNIITWEH